MPPIAARSAVTAKMHAGQRRRFGALARLHASRLSPDDPPRTGATGPRIIRAGGRETERKEAVDM
jgi:hypothetical protein